MALIKCSNCGKKISENADICPHCNYSFVDINFNIVAQVWLWLCVVLNLASSISALASLNFLNGSLSLLLCIANVLLITKKQFIYYITLVVSIAIVCIANICNGIPFTTAIIGFINPAITYLLTIDYWKKLRGVKNGVN